MTITFPRYVLIDTFGGAALNVATNAAYTGSMWHSLNPLTLTGESGIAFDLANTPMWIAVLSTLHGTPAVRRKLWKGRVRQPPAPVPRVLALLPQFIPLRATLLGLASLALLAVPLWGIIELTGIGAVSLLTAELLNAAETSHAWKPKLSAAGSARHRKSRRHQHLIGNGTYKRTNGLRRSAGIQKLRIAYKSRPLFLAVR